MAFVTSLHDKSVHAAINDYLLSAKHHKNLSRHHQAARRNEDGGNEAESRDENNELEKMINYLISQNQLII